MTGKPVVFVTRRLPLAVVAQLRGLQDRREQLVADRLQRGRVVHRRVRRAGHAAALELRLLGRALLADRHRLGARVAEHEGRLRGPSVEGLRRLEDLLDFQHPQETVRWLDAQGG